MAIFAASFRVFKDYDGLGIINFTCQCNLELQLLLKEAMKLLHLQVLGLFRAQCIPVIFCNSEYIGSDRGSK